MKSSRRTDFENSLKAWLERHQDFLNERTKNPETGKSHYTHPRLRSAYFSLKRNMGNLFVFEEHPDLSIPNTTNLLDRAFAGLKRNLECHHGMSKANKIKFIKDYFSENKFSAVNLLLSAPFLRLSSKFVTYAKIMILKEKAFFSLLRILKRVSVVRIPVFIFQAA